MINGILGRYGFHTSKERCLEMNSYTQASQEVFRVLAQLLSSLEVEKFDHRIQQ